MKNVSLAPVALVLLIVAGAVWLVLNFEYVTESQYVGLQGEARRNPLLAAMRLYERMGVPARAVGTGCDEPLMAYVWRQTPNGVAVHRRGSPSTPSRLYRRFEGVCREEKSSGCPASGSRSLWVWSSSR